MSKMEENKKSMTQNFIDNWLGFHNSINIALYEISEEDYNYYIKRKLYEKKFYQTWYHNEFMNLPHPLLRIHVIENFSWSTESGYEWDYRFVFKYKGKYYIFIDSGGM